MFSDEHNDLKEPLLPRPRQEEGINPAAGALLPTAATAISIRPATPTPPTASAAAAAIAINIRTEGHTPDSAKTRVMRSSKDISNILSFLTNAEQKAIRNSSVDLTPFQAVLKKISHLLDPEYLEKLEEEQEAIELKTTEQLERLLRLHRQKICYKVDCASGVLLFFISIAFSGIFATLMGRSRDESEKIALISFMAINSIIGAIKLRELYSEAARTRRYVIALDQYHQALLEEKDLSRRINFISWLHDRAEAPLISAITTPKCLTLRDDRETPEEIKKFAERHTKLYLTKIQFDKLAMIVDTFRIIATDEIPHISLTLAKSTALVFEGLSKHLESPPIAFLNDTLIQLTAWLIFSCDLLEKTQKTLFWQSDEKYSTELKTACQTMLNRGLDCFITFLRQNLETFTDPTNFTLHDRTISFLVNGLGDATEHDRFPEEIAIKVIELLEALTYTGILGHQKRRFFLKASNECANPPQEDSERRISKSWWETLALARAEQVLPAEEHPDAFTRHHQAYLRKWADSIIPVTDRPTEIPWSDEEAAFLRELNFPGLSAEDIITLRQMADRGAWIHSPSTAPALAFGDAALVDAASRDDTRTNGTGGEGGAAYRP